jgi:hypothetical protein
MSFVIAAAIRGPERRKKPRTNQARIIGMQPEPRDLARFSAAYSARKAIIGSILDARLAGK